MRSSGWVAFVVGAGASLFFSSGVPAQDRCSKFAVAGLRPGMSSEEVHAALGVQGASSQIVLPDGKRANVEDYALPGGAVHVEYDGVSSRDGQHVALVRQPLRQTYDTVVALMKRLGEPRSGADALVQGLHPDPAVWIDPKCDTVLTYYRRTESWFAEDVSTFLRLESLSRLPAESPASPAVGAYVASGPPPPSADAGDEEPTVEALVTAEPGYDEPPRRTEYVRPAYPAGAKQLGVKGVVSLHLVVERTGRVAAAKVASAAPEGYGFEEAAMDAAKRWRFLPASRDGRPIDGELDVVVRFQ